MFQSALQRRAKPITPPNYPLTTIQTHGVKIHSNRDLILSLYVYMKPIVMSCTE